MDLSGLWEKTQAGRITAAEVDGVAQRLSVAEDDDDRYTMLMILGYSGATRHRTLVERFLECREDPMLARAALSVLCDDWNYANEYLGQIRRFLRGVEWDDEEDVRLMAISRGGEYLRSYDDREILTELLRIANDRSQNPVVRQAAYRALGRAMGRDWRELPSASRLMDWDKELDPRVIAEANDRLHRQGRERPDPQ
jgi:hypothetical protein